MKTSRRNLNLRKIHDVSVGHVSFDGEVAVAIDGANQRVTLHLDPWMMAAIARDLRIALERRRGLIDEAIRELKEGDR